MKKEKLTIAEKLSKRKYKTPSSCIWAAYALLARSPFFGPRYNVEYEVIDDINKCEGPAFIIWNHQSRRDYLFLKNLIAPRKFNMLAGYQEFFRKKFALLFKLAQIIPKKNFTNDPKSIRDINHIIKSGGTVAFSPEGTSSVFGHNQPIVPGTGRFLKYYRVPVYFMKLKGSYLTSHKVCIDDRIGKVYATLSLLFKPEDLEKMSPEEIDNKINEAFRHDDYKWNKIARIRYNSKGKIMTNMQDMLYKCPRCLEELKIEASGRTLKCLNCGNGATMDDYYDFHPFDDSCKIFDTPTDWLDWERVQVIREIRNNSNFVIKEEVKIGELPKYKLIKDNNKTSVPCGHGVISFDHQGIHFDGIKNGEPWHFDLSYSVIYSPIIQNDLTQFALSVNEEIYDFFPKRRVVGKIILVVEEMHRLHFNTWKNFPWNDYMYQDVNQEKK
ncbi:MAG TPA: hypothetical protein GX010_00205 [Erysipelotrichaceae bacterium]|nr:hypothetical protein [Erysipelotrichaceae bacterium]